MFLSDLGPVENAKMTRHHLHVDASIIAVPAAQIIISTAIHELRKALVLFTYVFGEIEGTIMQAKQAVMVGKNTRCFLLLF